MRRSIHTGGPHRRRCGLRALFSRAMLSPWVYFRGWQRRCVECGEWQYRDLATGRFTRMPDWWRLSPLGDLARRRRRREEPRERLGAGSPYFLDAPLELDAPPPGATLELPREEDE